MLPADIIAEITTNLAALHLESNTAAQILPAVFAPLLRSERNPVAAVPQLVPRRRPRPRPRTRKASPRKQVKRRRQRSREAHERALAALKAHPGETVSAVAKAAGVSRSTVIAARAELAAAARKEARRKPRETAKTDEKTERRERAQRFLKDALAHGPKRVSDVEAAAAKAHVDEQSLTHARTDLGVVTSRGNTGNTLSVQWSLPG